MERVSVCCLLVLNSVTSTPQWICQPKPRDLTINSTVHSLRTDLHSLRTNPRKFVTKPSLRLDRAEELVLVSKTISFSFRFFRHALLNTCLFLVLVITESRLSRKCSAEIVPDSQTAVPHV